MPLHGSHGPSLRVTDHQSRYAAAGRWTKGICPPIEAAPEGNLTMGTWAVPDPGRIPAVVHSQRPIAAHNPQPYPAPSTQASEGEYEPHAMLLCLPMPCMHVMPCECCNITHV
jgi:hypothetical protein